MNKRKQAFQERKVRLDARDARFKQLVNENDLEGFKEFIEKQMLYHLHVKYLDYLLKKGSDEIIRFWLNNYGQYRISSDKLERYYPKLFQYCDRNTMAEFLNRVYENYKNLSQCEEILIKRGELNLFSFYTSRRELSKEAFQFLLEEGTPEFIENYLIHVEISELNLPIFLTYGKLEDIEWYFLTRQYIKQSVVINALKEVPDELEAKIKQTRIFFYLS